MNNPGATGSSRPFRRDDLKHYLAASHALEATRSELEALEQTPAVETFSRQMDLLRRRLFTDPRAFREMFITDGLAAAAAEFRQDELSEEFTHAFWELLLRDDDASRILMRFVWNVPLGLKRKFIRALDTHLSERYPLFRGLSE
ncbi:MAG: 2-polyprenylphenol hydroxylase, partial [Candidatus Accumulibacter sp.]|nr:2-polyprenylphenol hydroxylase [Accumulibacter sp.]